MGEEDLAGVSAEVGVEAGAAGVIPIPGDHQVTVILSGDMDRIIPSVLTSLPGPMAIPPGK